MIFKAVFLFLAVTVASVGIQPTAYATVSVNAARDVHTGNGSTKPYSYTFRILDKTHIAVYVAGVQKAVDVDYSVSGVGDANGGTIVFFTAPAIATQIVFLRSVPLSQTSTYIPNEAFPSRRIETDYDRIWMALQQLDERQKRSLMASPTSSPMATLTPVPGAAIGWNSTGTGFESFSRDPLTIISGLSGVLRASGNKLFTVTGSSGDCVRVDGTSFGCYNTIPGNGLSATIIPGAQTLSVLGQMSIAVDSLGAKLVNDSASPGNSKCYGTNNTGVRGWYNCAATTIGTALLKGDGAGGTATATGADVVARFTGTPDGTKCLKDNGTLGDCGSGGGGGSAPGGSDTQLQYRLNNTTLGGISGATTDGTNVTFGSAILRATRARFSTSIDDPAGNQLIFFPGDGTVNFGGATFGSGVIRATRPRFGTSIDDINGNQLIFFPGDGTMQFGGGNRLSLNTAGLSALRTWTIQNSDGIVPMVSGLPSNGNCAQWVVSGGIYAIGQSASGCGSGGGGASPGGADTQLQYRLNSTTLGGIPGATTDGTNVSLASAVLRATRPRITASLDDAIGTAVATLPGDGTIKIGSGFTIGIDNSNMTTDRNWTVQNASGVVALMSGTPTNDHCAKWSVASGVYTLVSAGSACGAGGGGISDGDKGDITVSGGGATWTIDNSAVTYSKIQNVSATNRVLGRRTAGAGPMEELSLSDALDAIGGTRGSILYRGASGWAILAPDTNGKVLTSNGANADPSYQTVSAAGISGLTTGAFVKGTSATTIGSTNLLDCGNNLYVMGTACNNTPDGIFEMARAYFKNVASPATPPTGYTEAYVDSTSKNWAIKDDAGVVKHGVRTTAAVSNQWISAIAADGTVTQAQPAFSNISGQATTAQLPSAIDFSAKTSTAPNKSGTTVPATCTVGETFFDTDAAAGQNIYGCTATNTWTLQGDGGGAGSGDITDVVAGAGISGGAASGSATVTWAPDTFVNNVTLWNSANATRTLTAGLSGATDPVITFSNNSIDVTTGTLKFAGATVSVSGHAHSASEITSGEFGTTAIADDAITYAKLQNISATQRVLGRNTAGAGNTEEVTAAQLLDWLGGTRGSILYRGASGWTALTPGTSGTALLSNGAGADPSYGAVSTASSTDTFTNKTFDAAGTGNTIKMKGFIQLSHPHSCDGTGATIGTTASAINYGHGTFSNSADEAANYCEYLIHVPNDVDTGVAMRARLKFALGGADTATHRYVLSMVSVADSAVPGSATLANAINLDFAGDASGANGDAQSVGWTTLTGWAGAVTADQLWRIRLARDGNATQDASTVNSTELGLVLEYGVTQ